jgi:hypothetical protein
MKRLILIVSFLLCSTVYATPSPQYYCMVKVLYVVNPNTLLVEDLYTKQHRTLVIAGTRITNSKAINLQAMQYDKQFCLAGNPNDYLGAVIYSCDSNGVYYGDIKHPDRIQQLSYLLIVKGLVYCTLDNTSALSYQEWARAHHNGIWR